MTHLDNKNFKDTMIDHFEHTTKTGWGKNEIVKEIKDLWIWFLEQTIESLEGCENEQLSNTLSSNMGGSRSL